MRKYFYLLFAVVLACVYVACSNDGESIETSLISIQNKGVEVQNNDVLQFDAAENFFGEMVAGHETEPTFIAKSPCKIEVTITLPDNNLDYFKWCGFTDECSVYCEPGAYTRIVEQLVSKAGMAVHASFKSGEFASCLVRVDVKVNGKAERTFFLQYNYSDNK